VTGLFGGAFDPPHNGHVALAEAAFEKFGLSRLIVLVVVEPAHKAVELPFENRFKLARLAFGGLPRTEVVPETHGRTVDGLDAEEFDDPIFLVGADEFAGFLSWKDPNGVLERTRLGVATRPGYSWERLEPVRAELERPDRVEFFDIPSFEVPSTEIRERARRGERIDDVVPEAVAREIEVAGLYR
jgi:nicotinate-nucleotide adenylyltransferase